MTDFEDKIGLEIPAYLRGELSPADMQRIEALAAKNPEIAADIEFQRNLMNAVKAGSTGESLGDFGWARLSQAMNEDSAAVDEILAPNVSNDNVAQPMKFWRIAAAALAVVALGQAGFIASQTGDQGDEARYVTVSEAPFIGVDIAFTNDASQMHVTELLQDVDGEFVSGPSGLGLYKVKFASKEACLAAVKAFNAADKVIETSSNCK